jgi:F0F1-type ATP synthase delta subunit
MEEIAEVYARALFEVAQEQDKLDEVHEQLGQFADAIHENRDMQRFFFSPPPDAGHLPDPGSLRPDVGRGEKAPAG